ncbi:hypothetical protein KK141_11195 [Dyella sp. LX-66]|uniref:hypothetical protein n=1 Tax=unclassified Dyella TaxID=2634549 RepID=UPI001BDFCD0D|nr:MULTISPECIES: hypothetical protein [unclassified Dyella]MBT2118910.1 hypothetical protein [Dyella sp. LX-1]MBT2140096.1 hypothetical protein [Dyella sp. LX-66]
MNAVNATPASVELVRLGLRLDAQRQRVTSSVARVRLDELDQRRRAPREAADAGLVIYLMAPLSPREDDIPEDAIQLLKRTMAQAVRGRLAGALLKQLWVHGHAIHDSWAVVETIDHQVAVHAAGPALSSELLTTSFHEVEAELVAQRMQTTRLLVEVAPSVRADEEGWDQLLERLVADVPAEGMEVLDAPPAPRTLKDQILASTVPAAEAARRLNALAEDATTWASRQRRADALFGVWSSRDRAFMHPDFQFAPGLTEANRQALFATLRTRAGFDPRMEDKGGWARAYWLYQPHPALSKAHLAARRLDSDDPTTMALTMQFIEDTPRAPAEVFAEDPAAVIALAQSLTAHEAAHD